MSSVLFAGAVARRAGVDVETANKVIAAVAAQIREMGLAGADARLVGVGTFRPVLSARPGAKPGALELTLVPVAELANIAPSKK